MYRQYIKTSSRLHRTININTNRQPHATAAVLDITHVKTPCVNTTKRQLSIYWKGGSIISHRSMQFK